MGGAAGHMMHIYEDTDLTFSQVKNMLYDLTQGRVSTFEKVDGQNLFVTYDESGLKAARNMSDIRAGGTPSSTFLARWAGHPAEKPFTLGFRAIETALRSLPREEVLEIFLSEGEPLYLNLEIVCSTHPNAIQYGSNFIVFHAMSKPTADASRKFNRLVSFLNGKEFTVGDTYWEFSGPRQIQIKPSNKANLALQRAVEEIDELGMSDSSTLGDFVAEKLRATIVSEIPVSVIKQEQIIAAVLGKKNAPSTVTLKSGEPAAVQKIISQLCTQENARKVRQSFLLPLEKIINNFALSFLSGAKTTLSNRHDDIVRSLRAEVEGAVDKLKRLASQGDEKSAALLDKQMSKLGSTENIDSSLEGGVFKHADTGNTYKLTGAFAMANQILGHAKRN